MRELSRHQALMETAEVWAKRGTCARLQVGAVFSIDGRILVQGYNGAPARLPHCVHECTCNPRSMPTGVHHLPNCPLMAACTIAEHAERNGIAWAARKGVKLEGSELHVTHGPCLACSMAVVNAGVVRVTFKIPYRLLEGVNLLASAGVEVVDFQRLVA